jgi:tetratricopeptide (TPR) repeat protein
MLKKYFYSSLILIASLFVVQAQESQSMIDDNAHYKNGVALYESGQLLAARKEFEIYTEQYRNSLVNQNSVKYSNAFYYIGAVATDLQQPDAEKILLDYIHNSHETALRRLAYFQLGKISLRKTDYDNAISWFEKVTKKDLNNTQRVEYSFKLGYAYFVNKEFDKAKPLFKEVKAFDNIYSNDANYYYGYIAFTDGDYSAAQTSFEAIQNIDSYKSSVPYYLAQIYFMKKNYDKVISYAKPYVADDKLKYQVDMMQLLGQSYYYKNDYTNAAFYLKKYIEKTPKVKKELLYQLAFSQYKNNDIDAAIINFKQFSIVDDSLGQNAMYALANCYLKKNNLDEAKTAYAAAMRMNGDASIKELANTNFIKLAYQLEDYNTVVNSAPDFINTYSKSESINDINQILATSLLKTKNYKEAIKVIEGIKNKNAILNKAYQQVCYYRGVQEYNDKNTEASIVLLDKSLGYPIDKEIQGEALFLKGEIFYNKAQYTKANVEYDKYIQVAKLENLNNENTNLFKAYYNQGHAYLKEKKYEVAKAAFSNAIANYNSAKKSDNAKTIFYDAYLRLADCYYITKDFTNAMPNYTRVQKEASINTDYASYQIAMVYGFMNKDKDKVFVLQNIAANTPNSPYADKALYEKGITYQQDLEDASSALASFTQLLNNYPNSSLRASTLLRMGLINFNLGNNDKALSYYKDIVSTYPKSDQSKEALSIMQEIYVSMGKPEAYIDYLQKSNIDVSASVQDSLYYKSAEERYFNSDCSAALTAFTSYLDKFPKGFFVDEANYYSADCHYKSKNYSEALKFYEVLVEKTATPFYERSLKRCATISYINLKDYSKSEKYYGMLYKANKGKEEDFAYLMNAMRSSYISKNDENLLSYSQDVIVSSKASNIDVLEARYYKAGVLIDRNEYDLSLLEYEQVAKGAPSAQTSESNYYLAYILNKKGQYQQSLDKALEVKDKVEGYDYWLAKLFILIGDNYAMLGNNYQAQATYESILENYDGDKKLVEEIKAKLEAVKRDAIIKSNIQVGSELENLEIIEENK